MDNIKFIANTTKQNFGYKQTMQNNDVTLEITPIVDGKYLNLTGAIISLNWLKPDNQLVTIAGSSITVAGSNVLVVLPKDCTSVPGEVKFELVITQSNKQVSTFPLNLNVTKSVYQSIVGSDSFASVVQDINEANASASQTLGQVTQAQESTNAILGQVMQAKEDINNFIQNGGAVSIVNYNTDKTTFETQLLDKAHYDRSKNIICRSKNIKALLRSGKISKGLNLGDSICAYTGASSYANGWGWQLATILQDYTKVGTVGDWLNNDSAVGGQSIPLIVNYISYDLDQSLIPKATKSYAYNYPYWVVMIGRNDCSAISLDDFAYMYRLIVRMAIQNGIDVICCTEPPQINFQTGEVLDGVSTTYPLYAQIIRDIAEDEGASLVDVYQEFLDCVKYDGITLKSLSSDGTHPNDAGHLKIANMIATCMKKTPVKLSSFIPWNEDFHNRCVPQQQMVMSNPNSATLESITVDSPTTARKEHLGTCNAIKIASGGSCSFKIPPIKCDYIIVTIMDKISTGTATIQCPEGLTLNTHISGNVYRSESSFLIKPSSTSNPAVNSVAVFANGGDVYVGGVTIIAPITISEHEVVNGTKTGTWANDYYGTDTFLTSSNVGDSITIKWFGTNILFNCGRDANGGKVGISTDGMQEVIYDLYGTLWPKNFIGNIDVLNLGWHTTTITVRDKNVSSTGNRVGIRNVGIYSTITKDNSIVAQVGDNIKVYLQNPYNFIRATSDYTIANNILTSTTNGVIETVLK